MNTKRTGKHAEELVEQYLTIQGLKPVTANYHCRHGEIDLIMEEDDTLVFVEVRFRASSSHYDFGGALASVTRKKKNRLTRSALHYLQTNHQTERNARIDVVALDELAISDSIIWIKNAVESSTN